MEVVLHFVAKPGRAAELESALRARGFGVVRCVAGSERVVLRASQEELRRGLGIQQPEGPDPAALPGEIAALVERWMRPPPPERWSPGS